MQPSVNPITIEPATKQPLINKITFIGFSRVLKGAERTLKGSINGWLLARETLKIGARWAGDRKNKSLLRLVLNLVL